MLFVVSLIIALFTAYQLNRFLQYEKFFDWLVGFVLIVVAEMVTIFTLAGLFYRMNDQFVILLMQTGLLGTVLLITWRLRAHLHSLPWLTKKSFDLSEFPRVLLGFAFIMLGVLALNLINVLFVSPNNNDSLMIHLARVGMWHQTGSWLPWNTPAVWQLSFPFDSEMMAFWSLLFLKREMLLAFFPLLSGILSAGIIYHLGVALFQKKAFALWAALIWLTLPVVQLNLSSSRHDHVSTFMLLAAFYFLVCGVKMKNATCWFLVGFSLALSIGTNMGVATYLPGIAVILLFAWLVLKKLSFQAILYIIVSSLVCFLLFSSPIYISNFIHFGTPLSPDADSMVGEDSINMSSPVEHFLLMNGRWAYQLLDCRGLPDPLAGYCHKAKAAVFHWIDAKTGLSLETEKALFNQYLFSYDEFYPLTEDSAWYGIVGAGLFIGVGVYSLIVASKRKEFFFISISLFILTIPITQSILWAGWKPYDGRYFLFFSALLCVGAVDLLDRLKPALRMGTIYVSSLLALMILAVTILQNPAKSFYGYRAFYQIHRYDMISAQSYFTKEMLYLVDQTVPETATLGLARSDREFYEYGLFGEHFTRQIVPVYPVENVCDLDWLQAQEIEYLLFNVEDEDMPDCEVEGYEYLGSMKNWMILAEE